jgi:pilus assembly protein Flp/PilA
MLTAIQRLLDDRTGTTAMEYGMIAALVSIAIIVGVTATGQSIQGYFAFVATQLSTVVP